MKKVIAFDLEELEEVMEVLELEHLGQVSNAAGHSEGAFIREFILPNKSGDGLFLQEIYQATDELKIGEITEHEIEYTPEGEPYIEPEGHHSRRYLKNYIRNNYGRRDN